MSKISARYTRVPVKAALLFFIMFAVASFAHSPTANADFRTDMANDYSGMPRELPDDKDQYPGNATWSNIPFNQQKNRVGSPVNDGNSHQYITVGGGSIDDAGGNPSGNYYRTATFIVYTTTPGKKRLTFTFVDRGVNVDGDTSTCNAHLMITPISQITGGGTGAPLDNDGSCGTPKSFGGGVDDRGLTVSDFVELTPVNSAGTPTNTGVYKAYVNVRLVSGSGNQASFRIKTDSDARIGYSTDDINTYGTRLANGHTISFKVRPPCNVSSSSNFTYSDADEQYSNIQPESAGGDLIYLRENNQIGSDGFISNGVRTLSPVTSGSRVPDFYEMRFRKIQGGNGITTGLPWDSGNYYFKSCPPEPNSGEVVGVCTNYSPSGIYPKDSVFATTTTTRYKMYSYSGDGGAGFLAASNGTAGGPANAFLGRNNPAEGHAQTWGWPNESIDGRDIWYKVDSYRGDASGNAVGIGNSGYMHYRFDCGTPPPSWFLQAYSGVGSPYVELGGSTSFDHSVYNRGPDAASGIAAGIKANYDIDNPNAGANGGPNDTNNVFGVDLGTIGTWGSGPVGLSINDNVSLLGNNYCQRLYINPTRMTNGNITEAESQSEARCSVVVGGKTGIGISRDPAEAEPEESITFNINHTTPTYSGGGGWGGYSAGCTWVFTSGASGSGSCTKNINATGGQTTTVNYTVPGGTPIGTMICMRATLTLGNSAFYLNGDNSPEICTRVVAKPYFKVFGGDISAGNGFSGVCLRHSSVIGWNTNDGARGYRGSGAQYAIYAQDIIKGVAPAQNLPSYGDTNPYTPSKLAFANTTSLAAGEYGGNFGSGSCSNDYWGKKPTTDIDSWSNIADSNNDTSDFDRNFQANGPLILNGVAEDASNVVQKGNNTKLYVDGDVYITSNIVAQTGAASVDQIPNFMLIVKGNIYIDKNVTSLYGTYIAQPDGNTKGEIHTCAKRSGNTFSLYSDSELYGNCQTQLRVTGAFVAQKLALERTKGSLYMDKDGNAVSGSGPANAAEIFQYNPLMWLRQSTSSRTTNAETYDAMSSQPPVL